MLPEVSQTTATSGTGRRSAGSTTWPGHRGAPGRPAVGVVHRARGVRDRPAQLGGQQPAPVHHRPQQLLGPAEQPGRHGARLPGRAGCSPGDLPAQQSACQPGAAAPDRAGAGPPSVPPGPALAVRPAAAVDDPSPGSPCRGRTTKYCSASRPGSAPRSAGSTGRPGRSRPAATRSSLISASAARTQARASSSLTPAAARPLAVRPQQVDTWCTSTLPSSAGVQPAVSSGSACSRQPSSTATVPIPGFASTCAPNSPLARYGKRDAAHSRPAARPGISAAPRPVIRAAARRRAAPARTAGPRRAAATPSGRHRASTRAATAATSGAVSAALPSTCQPGHPALRRGVGGDRGGHRGHRGVGAVAPAGQQERGRVGQHRLRVGQVHLGQPGQELHPRAVAHRAADQRRTAPRRRRPATPLAAHSRAAISQVRGLGQPRPAASGSDGGAQASAGRTCRNAATRASGQALLRGPVVGQLAAPAAPTSRRPARRPPPAGRCPRPGGTAGWPAARTGPSRRPPAPAGWPRPPPPPRRAVPGRRPPAPAPPGAARPAPRAGRWTARRGTAGRGRRRPAGGPRRAARTGPRRPPPRAARRSRRARGSTRSRSRTASPAPRPWPGWPTSCRCPGRPTAAPGPAPPRPPRVPRRRRPAARSLPRRTAGRPQPPGSSYPGTRLGAAQSVPATAQCSPS